MADLKEVLNKKPEVKQPIYTGEFRLINSKASPIEWDGNTYKPKDEGEVAELEYQVKQGRVTKS